MFEWCTNRSRLPSSGVMKPNPLSSLNHLTVPVGMWSFPPSVEVRFRGGCNAATTPGPAPTLVVRTDDLTPRKVARDSDDARPREVADHNLITLAGDGRSDAPRPPRRDPAERDRP